MKRFFKPVAKEGSSKKPCLSQAEKVEEKGEPSKFMTWNANSFLLRIKNNWPEFTNFVTTFDPDVIAIQVIHSLTHSLSIFTLSILMNPISFFFFLTSFSVECFVYGDIDECV
jgi:hypothetical protein